MSEYKLVIPYTLPGLNEYTSSNRRHAQAGARLKRDAESDIAAVIASQLRGVKISGSVHMAYLWVEKDMRRDGDNISSAGRKFIQDALVNAGVLANDSRKYITGFTDAFEVDKNNPRIEVIITQDI